MSAKASLLTAGYAGHTLESFLRKLEEYNVAVVVDVRQNPISRKKGFSRSRLSEFLAVHNVEYVHESELGVPRELRKQLQAGHHGLIAYFDSFRKCLAARTDALDRVYDLAIRKRCCLICLEHRAVDCHRSVVAQAVESRNGHKLEVVHI